MLHFNQVNYFPNFYFFKTVTNNPPFFNRGIKLLLKINKAILQTSFQHKDFFQSSQAYCIDTHGKILEKSINDYLSILVTKITISPNSVFLSNELIDRFNIEQDTVVNLEQFRSKSPDRTMEISSLLLDTSVDFNDSFDDIQYADRDDFSQHSNNSLEEIPREETAWDVNLIEPLRNLIKKTDITIETDGERPSSATDQSTKPLEPIVLIDKCLSSSQDQPSASIAFNSSHLVDPMQYRSIEADRTTADPNSAQLPLEPVIIIDKYISSPQDQPLAKIAFNQPQVVDPVQDVVTKELDQVTGKDFTQQEGEGSMKDISHSMNLMPEKEVREQEETTQDNGTQKNIYRRKGFIIRKDATEERLQDSTASEASCQRVKEGRVELSPVVHQTPSIAEKEGSCKVRVYKRRKRCTVDPNEMRRSPRLALKKRIQYYPMKRKNNSRIHIVAS